ncbi:MAG: hypothetical protein AABX48_02760 [Nanoarchaeota archaeon]
MERVEIEGLAESFLDFCVIAYNNLSVDGGMRGLEKTIVLYRKNASERLNSNSQEVLDIIQERTYRYLSQPGIYTILPDDRKRILESVFKDERISKLSL